MAKATPEERFWPKVDNHGPGDCWLWTAPKSSSHYGRFSIDGRAIAAHRYAYELLVGPIPEDLELDHLCRVRHCVNPDHLELVTHRENVLRGEGLAAQQARQTHCVNGHEFTEANTYHRPDYAHARQCRQCVNDRGRARRKT